MAADTNSPVPLLRVTDLTVRYGGVLALDSVSLDVPAAGFVGLIGPNGAGKTTFVDALTGFARYTGEVRFDGARLDRQPAYLRARHGLARTFQSGGVFDDLTVEENILIGERSGSGWLPALTSVLTGRSAPASRATREIVGSLGLTGLLGLRAEELSEGQRKLVSVAQALASKAKLLLLDEPAAGLDSAEGAWLRGCPAARGPRLGSGDPARRPRHGPGDERVRRTRGARLREGDSRGATTGGLVE